MLDVDNERDAAYYAVNTVHIRVRAAGEGITTVLLHSLIPLELTLLSQTRSY